MIELKRFRRQSRIPADRACKELGIARATLSRYETGMAFPRPEVLLKIRAWSGGKVTAEDFLNLMERVKNA